MIRLNRLSNTGEDAALARVEAIVERLDETPVERFALSGVSVLEPDAHARLVARLEAEADRCGRRGLLDDVRDQVRAVLVHRFSPLSVRTGFGFPFPLQAAARAADEALVVMVVVDAVAVALMEDRLDGRTAARLADPGRGLLGLPLLAESTELPTDAGIPEPTAADWAEAAAGDAVVGDPSPARPRARIVLAAVIACTAGPAAVLVGLSAGNIAGGVVAGLAVLALCWLIATYRG